MQALSGANEPGSKAVLWPVRRPHQNDLGCLDEEHAAATQQFSRFRSEADIQRAALTEPDL
jgi:hypothetical protein